MENKVNLEKIEIINVSILEYIMSQLISTDNKTGYSLIMAVFQNAYYENDDKEESEIIILIMLAEIFLFQISLINQSKDISILDKEYLENVKYSYVEKYVELGFTQKIHDIFTKSYEEKLRIYSRLIQNNDTTKAVVEYFQMSLFYPMVEPSFLIEEPKICSNIQDDLKRPIWEVMRIAIKINELLVKKGLIEIYNSNIDINIEEKSTIEKLIK